MNMITDIRKAQEKAIAQKLVDDAKQKVEAELKHAQALPLVRDRFLKAISLEPAHTGVFRDVESLQGFKDLFTWLNSRKDRRKRVHALVESLRASGLKCQIKKRYIGSFNRKDDWLFDIKWSTLAN